MTKRDTFVTLSSGLPLICATVIPNGREQSYGERQPPRFRAQLPESSFEVAQS